MQNSEYGKNVEQAVLAEADAWLAGAGETDYSLGACTPKEGSWYAVEVDGGEPSDWYRAGQKFGRVVLVLAMLYCVGASLFMH